MTIPTITSPSASPLPAGARTGLASRAPSIKPSLPPPISPLPHVPSLSVTCQVVRNEVLELKICWVLSRKGLQLGGVAVEEDIGAGE